MECQTQNVQGLQGHWIVFVDSEDKSSCVLKLVGTAFNDRTFSRLYIKNRTYSRLCPKAWCGQVPMSTYVPAPLLYVYVPKYLHDLSNYIFE